MTTTLRCTVIACAAAASAACGHAAPPVLAPGAPHPEIAIAPAPPPPWKHAAPHFQYVKGAMLRSGEGPIPDAEWAAGIPSWLAGEQQPRHMGDLQQGRPDDHARETLMKEHLVVTEKHFAWAGHACTEPRYQHRLVTEQQYREGRGLPYGSTTETARIWETRIECAPGRGDIGIDVTARVNDGKLEWVYGHTERFNIEFVRPPAAPPPIAAPKPGDMLAGEGPLPAFTWQSGAPAWVNGERRVVQAEEAGGRFVSANEKDADLTPQERVARSLKQQVLTVGPRRISFASRACDEPRFEQRIATRDELGEAQYKPGELGVTGRDDHAWLVRVSCPPGKGNLEMEFVRDIHNGKGGTHFNARFGVFVVHFEVAEQP